MEGSTLKSKTLNKDVSMTEDELFYDEFNTEPNSSCSKKVKKSKYNTKSVRNVAIHSLYIFCCFKLTRRLSSLLKNEFFIFLDTLIFPGRLLL